LEEEEEEKEKAEEAEEKEEAAEEEAQEEEKEEEEGLDKNMCDNQGDPLQVSKRKKTAKTKIQKNKLNPI
jgi:hypothetical protein